MYNYARCQFDAFPIIVLYFDIMAQDGRSLPEKERVSLSGAKGGSREADSRTLEQTQRAVRTEMMPGVGDLEVGAGVERVLPSEAREQTGENKHAQMSRQRVDDRKKMAAARRQRLIDSKPKPQVMVKQITRSLENEEKKLKRQARTLRRSAADSAFRLTQVVQRLREIRQLIATLADMAYDILKKLWLRVVHGIV